MRVLHLDASREWRGGQVQLLALLRATGHHLAAPDGSPLAARARAVDVPVHPLPGPWGLRRLARDFDLVAAHTSGAHTRGLACGRPLVVHRRVDFVPKRTSRPKYRAAHGYVAVSAAVARVLVGAGVPAGRVAVVHDGIGPPESTAGAFDLDGAVVAVGALVPHKGHRVLIEAMQGLGTLVIFGDGPLRAPLAELAARLGVDLRLPGWRADVRSLLPRFRCLVHPSIEEGLGQAVIEAMWAGLPVIVSDAGGLPEVVGDTATIVPRGSATALREALEAPLPEPERARQRAHTVLTTDAMVAGSLAAYHRFLG